jgi:hypothetical protein
MRDSMLLWRKALMISTSLMKSSSASRVAVSFNTLTATISGCWPSSLLSSPITSEQLFYIAFLTDIRNTRWKGLRTMRFLPTFKHSHHVLWETRENQELHVIIDLNLVLSKHYACARARARVCVCVCVCVCVWELERKQLVSNELSN